MKILIGCGAVLILIAFVCLQRESNRPRQLTSGDTAIVADLPARASSPSTAVAEDASRPPTSAATRESLSSVDLAPVDLAPVDLLVRVTVPRSEGIVRAALFRLPEGFPDHKHAIHTQTGEIVDAIATLSFSELTAGQYALAVFQDLNDDRALNKSKFGIPQEPYGFSNNARGRMGPPSFQSAAFKLSHSTREISIDLK